ncbi:unnamed protein product, partial [Phaeothamnion confervicola]
MLDQVCIFDKSGVVLWSKTMSKLKGSPVNDLIKSVLLEERGGSASVTTDWYKLQWTLANELDFVVVVVYQKMLQLAYVDELLTRIKRVGHCFCDATSHSLCANGQLTHF